MVVFILTLCLVAFGANSSTGLSANARHVAQAIGQMPGRVVAASRLFRTPAWPTGSGPDFSNCAIILSTNLPPERLLDCLHRIEARHGRVRDRRWEPRSLDIDLLAVGARVMPDMMTWRRWKEKPYAAQLFDAPDRLILPHPRLTERAFVLIPLMDVAPAWRHPATGRTVRSMVAGLSARERREIRPVGTIGGVVNRKCGA
ncbi:2-amino-4-hydroxy-6-hydroxymethyldihydropteridine diphosphokinase [Jannaschia donghaensis]|uniref:2-amino-4-hydroxy-6-hydroxymethyldihydropteridine pyrophosphokinase n=1 Tax=Jannaschia donghaensis TaxID=420998 RepID=A0A0M6YJS0_9RHOB|nr:2-amino-4-hydroxy-6-hydroxymethyldihydropteridine diphosphokinase [Jannaschia donghaensis]CTQ50049.1 2-amino-4-hydroxy-6-hydroxymethyldihydropteridinepyrophosphokinase [Jannaschia donghaensis]